MRVLVISSVVPNAKGFGGELVLHRYLNETPGIKTTVFQWEKYPIRLKIFGKLRQLGFGKASNFMESFWPVLPADKLIREHCLDQKPDVIMTVAHGWLHVAARRAAKVYNIPLVTFFQDWWADFEDVPGILRRKVEYQIRLTGQASNKVIGVSEGMLQEVGKNISSILLHDIPSEGISYNKPENQNNKQVFKVVYFGNLTTYGPMIESALLTAETCETVRIDVFGGKPIWKEDNLNRFSRNGNFLGSLNSKDLIKKIKDYDAILVTMSFQESMTRRMRTSFPSKLIEGTQIGKPIVIWGPEGCSAVEWAKKEDKALCITSSNAEDLVSALQALSLNPAEQDRLKQKSAEAASKEFNPSSIRNQFLNILSEVCEN